MVFLKNNLNRQHGTGRILLVAACACAILLLGCDRFRQTDSLPALNLAPNRMAPDAVALEIGIAQLDTSQAEILKQYWHSLDQQELPLATRQQLDRHGLKVGIMSTRPPATFSKLVNPREIVIDELDAFQRQLYLGGHLSATSRMLAHNRISNRKGQPHPIVTSPEHPTYRWAIQDAGGAIAETSTNVRGIFSIRTYPQGDGSVRIVVQPQVHHGELEKRYGATANGFKFEKQQAVAMLEQLEFEVPLRSGETLVIGPTADIDQLGRLFFGDSNESEKNELLDQADWVIEAIKGRQEDSLPELGIDQSKFKDLIDDLDIDDVDRSLMDSLGAGFGKPTIEKPQPLHRLLMIRVVQTQLDDLFDDQAVAEPLTTSREF